MDPRKRLAELLVERSVRLGTFTLASGRTSSYYIDARRTTMSAEGQFLLGKVCRDALGATGWGATHVGGLTLGADPVAYAIAHRSWSERGPAGSEILDAFTVRKEPKGHGTKQQIEGGLPAGARCVVVEDSMTTGGSTLRAIRILQEHGARVVGVLTLVDREEGARERFASAGHPFLAIFGANELLELARAREEGRSRGSDGS